MDKIETTIETICEQSKCKNCPFYMNDSCMKKTFVKLYQEVKYYKFLLETNFQPEKLKWHNTNEEKPNKSCEVYGRNQRKVYVGSYLHKWKYVWDVLGFETTYNKQTNTFSQECEQWAYKNFS